MKAATISTKPHYKQPGFTIVELLIVIVVIGILAAITIVAFNGVQTRARAAQAQVDANSVGKLLAIANVNNGSFPNDLSTVNNGQPVSIADGTSYSYHPGSGNSSYCVTVTNSTTSYRVTDTAVPVAGGCPGDGVGGVAAVTNLSLNPSAENNVSGMLSNTGSPTVTQSNTQAKIGTYSFALTSTVVSPDDAGFFQSFVQPGSYTLSYYYFTPVSRSVYFDECNVASGVCTLQGGLQTVAANTWTRIVATFTITGTGTQTLSIYLHGTNGPNSTGNTVYMDGFMLTAGTSTYNYADGNSPSWIWNGAANTSTSTGPPL